MVMIIVMIFMVQCMIKIAVWWWRVSLLCQEGYHVPSKLLWSSCCCLLDFQAFSHPRVSCRRDAHIYSQFLILILLEPWICIKQSFFFFFYQLIAVPVYRLLALFLYFLFEYFSFNHFFFFFSYYTWVFIFYRLCIVMKRGFSQTIRGFWCSSWITLWKIFSFHNRGLGKSIHSIIHNILNFLIKSGKYFILAHVGSSQTNG